MIEKRTNSSKETFKSVPISDIRPSTWQVRTVFDPEALEELANSIREEGLAQPILIRPIPEDNGICYEIIAGERRWRACRLLGMKTIQAVVKEVDDKVSAILGMVENLQRENLTPIEEARGYKMLIDRLKMTQADIAEKVGKSRPSISNSMRLLSLDPEVVHMVETKQLEAASARFLLALPKDQQITAAATVINKGLTSKSVDTLVKTLVKKSAEENKISQEELEIPEKPPQEEVETIEDQILSGLPEGFKVIVTLRKKGGGSITFNIPEEHWDAFISQFTTTEEALD